MSLIGLGSTISAPPRHRSSPPVDPGPDLRLKWAPPDTSGYTVINVPASGAGTNGRFQPSLTAGVDYLVVFPADQKRIGNVTLSGGRNIVIKGGESEIVNLSGITPANQDRRNLYITNNTGDVWIEGHDFHINGTNDPFDCLYFHYATTRTTTITIQNCLFRGIIGNFSGFHGDGVQFEATALFNGLIRFHRCTFRTAYQGYYNVCDGLDSVAQFEESNLVCTGSDGVPFWAGDDEVDDWARKFVEIGEGVYLDPDAAMIAEVRPSTACPVVAERPVYSNGTVSWPTSDFITGSIIEGVPPGGDYVTSDIAGYDYESPGYQP